MRKKAQTSLPVLSLPYGINECGVLLVDTAKKKKRKDGKEEGNSPSRTQTGLSAVEESGGVDFDTLVSG